MAYDAAGRVQQSTDPRQLTSTFSYTSLGQPTSASYPATGSTSVETVSYGYGANGRTESVTDNRGTTTLAYETGNDRVASVSDPVTGAVGYTYGLAAAHFSAQALGAIVLDHPNLGSEMSRIFKVAKLLEPD